MNPKKLVCYLDDDAYFSAEQIQAILEGLKQFHNSNKGIILLPDTTKIEYLDAFSIRKFVKNTAMKLKLRFGK